MGVQYVSVRIWSIPPWQLQDWGQPDPGRAWCLQTQALACVAAAGPLMRLTWKPGGKAYLRSGSPSQSLVVLTSPSAWLLQSSGVPAFQCSCLVFCLLYLYIWTPVFLHLLPLPCSLLLSAGLLHLGARFWVVPPRPLLPPPPGHNQLCSEFLSQYSSLVGWVLVPLPMVRGCL